MKKVTSCFLYFFLFMFFLTFISQNICFAQLNLVDDLFKAVRRLSKYRNISKFEYKKLLKTLNASELTLVVNNLPTNLRNEALLEIAQQRNLIKPIEFISLRRQLSTVTVYEKTLIKHISNNEKNLAKKIETEVVKIRNSKLAGKTHPVTGVPYNSRGFPQFESKFKVKLPKNLYKKSNNEQFAYANKQLAKDIEKDKKLRDQFTERQLEQIRQGKTPEGFVWHHHEDEGVLQLVDAKTHQQTGHTGGRVIWGM